MDKISDSWNKINYNGEITGRYGHSVNQVDKLMYVIGGRDTVQFIFFTNKDRIFE
jgi:hypothetical protein